MDKKEKHIIRLLNRQDKRAISLLYDDFAPTLYGIALRVVRSETIAQDIVQETFVKAWMHGKSYDRSKGTLFTWLLNITRNRAIDVIRSATFRQSGKIQPMDSTVFDNERLSTHQNTDQIGLRKIVGSLEEKYRIVIDLAYFQGFTQQEISDHLDIPPGTVKSRVRIALRELRKFFEEQNIIVLWIIAPWLSNSLGSFLLV
ncbi:MAG: sigma-70 family RNA polymerase sigma factor [Lewinellaceae bacterium]|nr:sigma-70 family RNA polymerase sigma factor [Phaeodactylibacter sp.]MCB0615756.1 sigma-70 family RNA polymerase sigma factor [Phaeodactylibacter sp.]MCB9346507.1 sigma-70 family RNA polymerase sigma factor [Lewinellaceae bacterium]